MTRASRSIPAMVTTAELAGAIDRELAEVVAVLEARGEPSGPTDVMSGQVAVAVAGALGCTVKVEPRDLALEALYELETNGISTEPPGRAGRLYTGVVADIDRLDATIEGVSEHWTVSRMPLIDRNILRLALHEVETEADTPSAVIVAEALRLANTYSTEKSASFVNGILSTLVRSVRGTG